MLPSGILAVPPVRTLTQYQEWCRGSAGSSLLVGLTPFRPIRFTQRAHEYGPTSAGDRPRFSDGGEEYSFQKEIVDWHLYRKAIPLEQPTIQVFATDILEISRITRLVTSRLAGLSALGSVVKQVEYLS